MHSRVYPIGGLAVTLLWCGVAFARNCPDSASATLVSLQGQAAVASTDGASQPAKLNQAICPGDQLRTQANSRASIELPGNEIIRLNGNTDITLAELHADTPSIIKLVKGFLNFISRKPKEIKIENGITNAMPLGTEFAFNAEDDKAEVWVYEGKVKVYNDHGSVILKPGPEYAEVQKGQAPKIQIDIKPLDAVNWALYYPPLLPYPDKAMVIDEQIRTAIQDYRLGHPDAALWRMDNLPLTKQTPYFYKVRAAMRLTVGQDTLAQQDIAALLAGNPSDAEALALQSVRALTQNRKDEAIDLAQKAVAANPKSASAYSALSYAEQGRFKLDEALAAAEQAASLAPHDAMVVARKAELQLAQGQAADSEDTAQQAITLDANLERSQTVRGFTDLMQMETDAALQHFDKAIQLDSTSPLARLGLGLAKIRQGDLEPGRKDIEIAALLDPNNSLIRSYLGKAYYEEKRGDLAAEQFNLAKQRDPKDPTPYFYDALKKQTDNRPIEALHDLQKAMELNDNRGVYRSKQLLDSDRAARGASLARVYDTLGFEQRGILEAATSLAEDPTNYSAHRFLSDSYVRFPARGAAQASELLQAQLLQPININPIQPHLAVSNRSLLISSGISEPLFRDYSKVFELNRPQLTISGSYGNLNTGGDEAVISGIHDNLSYSFGQFHFSSDGFRENADISHDIYNAFIQYEISKEFNVQFEYLHRETNQGNLLQDFVDVGGQNSERYSLNQNKLRGGFHYHPYSNIDIIGNISYLPSTDKIFSSSPRLTDTERIGLQGELQGIIKSKYVNFIFGGNAYSRENNAIHYESDGSVEPIKDGSLDYSSEFTTSDSGNSFYVYSQIKLPLKITSTLGLKYTFFNTNIPNNNPENRSFSRIKPKFGIQWDPIENLTLRYAYSENIKQFLFIDQTLEPTNIVGFNQLYDDINGRLSNIISTAIDFKFPLKIFSGFQFSRRDIDRVNFPDNLIEKPYLRPARESDAYRGYLYWMMANNMSLTAEYIYERDSLYANNIENQKRYGLSTIKAPIKLSYFHPKGFFGQVGLTYVSQDEININDQSFFANNFLIGDLTLGYRFPKRLGFVSLEIKNLTDKHFKYNDKWRIEQSDFFQMSRQQEFVPNRTILARVLFNF